MKNKAAQCLGMRRYVALRGEYGFKITENFYQTVTTDKHDYRFSQNSFTDKFFPAPDRQSAKDGIRNRPCHSAQIPHERCLQL